MVLGDEDLRERIIKRLMARSSSLDERQAAKARIEREQEALALAEKEGRRHDIYRHLVNIGTCYGVLANPHKALAYFKRAVKAFPERRFPLWVVIMILGRLDEKEELERYSRLYEERFPPKRRSR
jgi:tetratricopeptide (TPR) repeat protein